MNLFLENFFGSGRAQSEKVGQISFCPPLIFSFPYAHGYPGGPPTINILTMLDFGNFPATEAILAVKLPPLWPFANFYDLGNR
jgi:hypothetical protein